MTDADRVLILSADSRSARAQLAPFLAMGSDRIAKLSKVAPSYVVGAIQELLAGLTQWERDESVALLEKRDHVAE